MAKHDITQTNRVARAMIEKTENPRHRFLLMAYDRHRSLEMAGRYEELFTPDMMVGEPALSHPRTPGEPQARGRRSRQKPLSHVEGDQPVRVLRGARRDRGVGQFRGVDLGRLSAGVGAYAADQQDPELHPALSRRAPGEERAQEWEVRGRRQQNVLLYKKKKKKKKRVPDVLGPTTTRAALMGEDIWEPDPQKAEIVELAPEDVLTMDEAGRPLDPLKSSRYRRTTRWCWARCRPLNDWSKRRRTAIVRHYNPGGCGAGVLTRAPAANVYNGPFRSRS